MGLQYKACTKGEIGYFTNKQIVSYLPEQGEIQQRKKRRTDNDGVTREFEEEERHDPTTIEQWKRQMTVFKNTLLMCTWAFPQFSQFNVTKTDMDEFYDFIYGSEIATRTPAPSLAVLMIAERKAWREVVLQMHKGTNLKEAIQNTRNNHLFWNREVYERIHHNNHYNNNNQAASGAANQAPYTPTRRGLRGGSSQHSQQWSPDKPTRQWNATPLNYDNQNTYSPKGKGKTQNKHWVPPPPAPYHKGNKGKDGGKKGGKDWGKGAGKGKGKASLATHDPKGKEYCRKHWHRLCLGNCGRSHQCPVIKPDGEPCNGNHAGLSCNYNQ
jgi:hypothetical protein